MWRDLLYEHGVRHMSLSFMGLRRRVKRLDRWRLSDKFPADVKIYLDSGAFTLNRADSSISAAEAAELRESYFQFVESNIHDLEFASEFDADVLGHEAVHSSRDSFWHALPGRKWMPVWHADYGTNNLITLSDEYDRVGVLQDDAAGDLSAVLNRISGQTMLHGVSMTRQAMMEAVRWASVGSTRWLAPTQYGETFVWTGRDLKDYPKKQQEQGRKRHRTWLADQGFDTVAIEAGDNRELLRLSIWSWQKYAESLGAVTTAPEMPDAGNAEQPVAPVATPSSGMWNEPAPLPVLPRERTMLPVIGFDYENITERGDDGQETERQEARLATPSSTLLQCNTCYMKDKCPAREANASCKYDIPVTIRTPGQMEAVKAALTEMQVQRVLLMRMIEQTEGGYVDENLSREMTRAWKMLQDQSSSGDTVKLTLEAGGQAASAGMISRIFGSDAGDRLAIANGPVDSQAVMENFIEAEVIEG